MKEDTSKKAILIVEDEPFLRELCLKKFATLDYNVETAADGSEAMTKIEALKPRLILLDLIIPGIDGFKLAEKIRAHPEKEINEIPIIVLSNLGQQEDIDRAITAGANDYLIKSNFTVSEIVEKAQKFL